MHLTNYFFQCNTIPNIQIMHFTNASCSVCINQTNIKPVEYFTITDMVFEKWNSFSLLATCSPWLENRNYHLHQLIIHRFVSIITCMHDVRPFYNCMQYRHYMKGKDIINSRLRISIDILSCPWTALSSIETYI
jgi:uncharacterized protein (DUF427 family)